MEPEELTTLWFMISAETVDLPDTSRQNYGFRGGHDRCQTCVIKESLLQQSAGMKRWLTS